MGLPGADLGIHLEDPTIAELLKPLGYATGQFGKNHLGDKDEFLPTNHGFDEFFGNLYHLNAEEEPENSDYPKDPEFRRRFGPLGVLKSTADGKIEDTGPLTKKCMEKEFLYWTDDGGLAAIRHGNWKVLFLEQRAIGGAVWADPFVPLRWPRVINLRMDPLERAVNESANYTIWSSRRMFALVPAQAFVAQWLSSFKGFPPRQKPASFSIDQVMDKLTSAPAGGNQ